MEVHDIGRAKFGGRPPAEVYGDSSDGDGGASDAFASSIEHNALNLTNCL